MTLFNNICFSAVDDLEEGRGADEELCLLPDEEREISDADKERAIANQQADENDDQDNEAVEDQENEAPENNIEENGEYDDIISIKNSYLHRDFFLR